MTTTTIILLGIIFTLSVLLIIAIYGLYNAWRKITYYEDWFTVFEQHVVGMKNEIERIDTIGSFESDDEVGYFFKALSAMVDDLYQMGFYETKDETDG